jgi:hypothetical protein
MTSTINIKPGKSNKNIAFHIKQQIISHSLFNEISPTEIFRQGGIFLSFHR